MASFTGTLYMTTDINMVQQSINNCKCLMVTNEPLFEGHPNRVGATILLPPTTAIIADADDDMETFQMLYYQYLISDEVTEFFSLLFLILHKGVNVLMYIPKEDAKSLDYVGFLLSFFLNNYGIQVGTDTTQFTFFPQFEGLICDTLYLNDLIDYKDLLMTFPVSNMSDMTINKLYIEMSPYQKLTSVGLMRQYFLTYQQNMFNKDKYIPKVVSYRKED